MKLDCTLTFVICGLGLAACSSVTMPGFDAFKAKPQSTYLLIESNPPGAEARASIGKTCHTPCTMAIDAANDFTVIYALEGYVPQTLTVHSTMSGGGFMTAPSPALNPNPIAATLEPVAPQPKAPKPPPRQRS